MAAQGSSHHLCSRGHAIPSIGRMLASFDIQDQNVLNIYIVGSHMWETCHNSSDWDLVIVVEKLSSPKPLNHHKGNLEAFILSKEQYVELLNTHSLQLLLTLWLPKMCVMREKFNPRDPSVFTFSKNSLVRALEHHRERDFKISRKHFLKDDRKTAKKILLHCVRYIDMGVQIKTCGQISSYVSANQYREVILDSHCEEWSDLLAAVSPVFDQLWTELLS